MSSVSGKLPEFDDIMRHDDIEILVAAHSQDGPPLILRVLVRTQAEQMDVLERVRDAVVMLAGHCRGKGYKTEVRFAKTPVG